MTTDTAQPLSAWAPGELDEGVAGEQRHVAAGDEHGAAQVGGQGQQAALDGSAGALHLVLVGEDEVGVEVGAHRDDLLALVAHDHARRGSAPVARAARMAWPTSVTPPIGCSTLGVEDFIRVPSPAARTMTAAGRGVLTREDSRCAAGCHGTPSCYSPRA